MLLAEMQAPLVCSLLAELDDLADVRTSSIGRCSTASAMARDGGVMRDGVDRARRSARHQRSESSGSPRWRRPSAPGPASPPEDSVQPRVRNYIEVSKSNLPTFRPIITANRRLPAANASLRQR
jgi:hypothetical protein